jgi:hypothetical protein
MHLPSRMMVGVAAFTLVFATVAEADTDWANPPVACIEDLVPQNLPCLDLSRVANPTADLPDGLSEAQLRYWKVEHAVDLNVCRAKEVNRRAAASPGSVSAAAIAWAWMWTKSAEDVDLKVDAVYEAAAKAQMPPQVLFGALKQESLLSSLGIGPDGGNFSCGIGQINVQEWCGAMRSLTESEQRKLGWPVGVSCSPDNLPTELVRPFYDIAVRGLDGRPDYELEPRHFDGIRFEDVAAKFPEGTDEQQRGRFAAVASFVRHCSDLKLGIWAKGHELKTLYDGLVPPPLKSAQSYKPGGKPDLKCRREYPSRAWPLQTGWLLADAIYNAGSREVAVLQHYFRMTKESNASGTVWKKMTPLDLIEGLHWGGKWNPTTKKIEYQNVSGDTLSQSWFKSCVVQRHIARVIQYATRPGVEIARSLEVGGCSQTTVPEYRKASSGRKESRRRPRG